MNKEIEIPEGYEARIEDNKVILIPKESEDERIRKTLIRCCDDWEKGQFGCMAKEDVPAIRAYLKKQKESTWTEEDESFVKYILPRILKPDNWTLEQKEADKCLLKEFISRQKNKCVEKQKEQDQLSTEETELNSIAFLEQLGYTCVPPGEEQKLNDSVEKFEAIDIAFRRGREVGFREGVESVKPAEWSEKDETCLENALWCVIETRYFVAKDACDLDACRCAEKWLESLPERFNLKPKQECSKKDGWIHRDLMNLLVPPLQLHWKPSEEQMRVFLKANPVNLMPEELSIYNSLCNDIQKLM